MILRTFLRRSPRGTAVFSLLLLMLCALVFEVEAQPGGCYAGLWHVEYCREQRAAVIKNYESKINEIDRKISLEPRNAENYYLRAKIYNDVRSQGLGGEFDGKVYFPDLDAGAFADLNTAIQLDPKPQYFSSRAEIYQRYWKTEVGAYWYFADTEYKPAAQIFEASDKLFLNNEYFKAAEKDFLKCFSLGANRQPREMLELCGGYVLMRQTRAYELGRNEYVAGLIGKTKAADTALADMDYAIEATKAYSRDSGSAQAYLVDKARTAVRFGRDDDALKSLNDAEKLTANDKSQFCQIYSIRAAIFSRQRKIELAVKDADTAIAGSQYWVCQNMLEFRGDYFRARGDVENALKDYSNLLKTDSTLLTGVYSKRGKLYLQIGEVDKAVADFTAAIGYGSLCEKDYEIRAKAYRLAGNEQAAAEDNKKVLELIKRQKELQLSSYCSHHGQ